MKLTQFLQQLHLLGINLSLDGAGIKVQAPKGAVTAEVRDQLGRHRDELLHWLRQADHDDDHALPVCVPDPARLHEPFALSDLQLGFSMADDPYMEFHVRPHYYIEHDAEALDPARYQAAWNKALQRHHRAITVVQDDGRMAVVSDPAPLRCQTIDLRQESRQTVETRLMATREQMQRCELPLDRWPWLDLRVSLWRGEHGEPRARIHYNHNNFFWDGYGTQRLLLEVQQYYDDPALVLPPLSLGLRDAIITLDQLAESPQGAAARRYWEDRLADMPGPPPLPLRAGVERRCRSRLQRREQLIDADAWQRFKAVAQDAGLTPSNAMFSVYAELLCAWSNSRHFVLSNMMTRRLGIHPEMRDILGNFVSLYPLEIDLRGPGSFIERARRVQEQVLRDARHLQWGGMRVMQALSRKSGGFGRTPSPFVVSSGLFMEGFERADFSCLETSQVMLDHQFWELADGRLYYVWDLLEEFFPAGVIDDMWQAYAGLITELSADATLWQRASLPLTPAAHLQQREAVRSPDGPPSLLRLDDFVRTASQRWPHAPALCGSGSGAGRSFRALDTGSDRLAAALQQAGVSRGDVVAVVADRGAAMLDAVYATLKVGAAYLPVDPSLPDERRAYLLADSGAAVVLAAPNYAARLQWPAGLRVVSTDTTPAIAAQPARRSDVSDLAYVIYTSGSTGRPKGVMIDHRGAVNTVLDINERFKVGPDDRVFGVSSFGFDLSVYDIFGTVQAGASLVYPDPAQALDPVHWLELMRGHGITIWNSAPPLMSLLVEAAAYRGVQLPDLRLVLLSGDWIPVDLPERIRAMAPGADVVSLGGATEASIWSIVYPIDRVDPGWSSIPYGYPLHNQSWHVLDDWLRPVPCWTAGELYIGGIGLALGYRGDPGKTEASFIVHPAGGERLYRTGDLGRFLPNGAIEFLGRKDSQVKIQGHRIELGEIEAVLAACPAVADAVVVAQRQEVGGSLQLVAHVVPAQGARLDPEALRAEASRKLPDYMVPRLFNALERLPLSSNGKLDRKALPRVLPGAASERVEPAPRREPLDAVESRLLAIWHTVLGHDGIAPTDDFFDLGGQSFEAVRMVGMIRDAFGISLSIGDIWLDRSVARLAERLRSGAPKHAQDCLLDIDLRGGGTPLFLVHPAGGHVLCYRELGARLHRPVRAFQAPGVDGSCEPPASIAEFAEAYVALLQKALPEGPVLLGGWSSGAVIAHEMAAQLRAQGRTVEGLIVIDSPAPLMHDAVPDDTLLDWFLGDLDLPAPAQAELAAKRRTGLDQAQRLAEAAAVMREHGVPLGGDSHQLDAIYGVFKAIVVASRAHRPVRTDVDVLVLRASQGVVGEFSRHPHQASLTWGWPSLGGASAEGCWIEGNHYGLLSLPAVQTVGTAIEHWLVRRKRCEPASALQAS